jgi:hypothetical protein
MNHIVRLATITLGIVIIGFTANAQLTTTYSDGIIHQSGGASVLEFTGGGHPNDAKFKITGTSGQSGPSVILNDTRSGDSRVFEIGSGLAGTGKLTIRTSGTGTGNLLVMDDAGGSVLGNSNADTKLRIIGTSNASGPSVIFDDTRNSDSRIYEIGSGLAGTGKLTIRTNVVGTGNLLVMDDAGSAVLGNSNADTKFRIVGTSGASGPSVILDDTRSSESRIFEIGSGLAGTGKLAIRTSGAGTGNLLVMDDAGSSVLGNSNADTKFRIVGTSGASGPSVIFEDTRFGADTATFEIGSGLSGTEDLTFRTIGSGIGTMMVMEHATGDVGINTADPTAKLDVNGDARIRGLTAGSSDNIVVAEANGDLRIRPASEFAGTQGPAGEQGPAGADGTQGLQGEQGPAGAAAPCVDCDDVASGAVDLACLVLGENVPTSVAQIQAAATIIVNTLLISTNICEDTCDIGAEISNAINTKLNQ